MLSARDFIKIQYEPLKNSPALKADFRVGDTVKVHQMIKEITTTKKNISKTAKKALEKSGGGEKGPVERIQVFEGIVIARKHGTEPGGSFTVRKIAAGGVAVEKIYPLYSPTLKKIEVVSRPKVRRAKLYFLRNRTGQAARRLGIGVAVETEADSIPTSASPNVTSGELGTRTPTSPSESEQAKSVGAEIPIQETK